MCLELIFSNMPSKVHSERGGFDTASVCTMDHNTGAIANTHNSQLIFTLLVVGTNTVQNVNEPILGEKKHTKRCLSLQLPLVNGECSLASLRVFEVSSKFGGKFVLKAEINQLTTDNQSLPASALTACSCPFVVGSCRSQKIPINQVQACTLVIKLQKIGKTYRQQLLQYRIRTARDLVDYYSKPHRDQQELNIRKSGGKMRPAVLRAIAVAVRDRLQSIGEYPKESAQPSLPQLATMSLSSESTLRLAAISSPLPAPMINPPMYSLPTTYSYPQFESPPPPPPPPPSPSKQQSNVDECGGEVYCFDGVQGYVCDDFDLMSLLAGNDDNNDRNKFFDNNNDPGCNDNDNDSNKHFDDYFNNNENTDACHEYYHNNSIINGNNTENRDDNGNTTNNNNTDRNNNDNSDYLAGGIQTSHCEGMFMIESLSCPQPAFTPFTTLLIDEDNNNIDNSNNYNNNNNSNINIDNSNNNNNNSNNNNNNKQLQFFGVSPDEFLAC